MAILGLLLTFLTGFLLLKRISMRLTLTECVGFAFTVGLGLITFVMMLLDWVGIGLTATTNLITTVVVFLVACMLMISQRRELMDLLKQRPNFNWMNLVWLVLLILVVYAEYSNLLKTLYFPTYDRDSMAGFDTIGYIAAQEHTYKGMSIFDGSYMPKIHEAGSYITYMPMLQLAYAYVYSLGEMTSKAIPALVFLSFLIGFYGVVKRASCPTAAMLATFGMMMSPELFSFSSLSNTNVIHATVASAAVIYMCLWFRDQRRGDLVLGCVLLAINIWLRTEGIVFIAATFLLVAWHSFRQKDYRVIGIWAASLLPLVVFLIYAATSGLTADSVVITRPFWDAPKAHAVGGGLWFMLAISPYYGWTFQIFALALLGNVWFMWKRRDSVELLLVMITAILVYAVILYQIDYVWDSLLHVINFSAKRFLFCFVPIAWFFIVTNQGVKGLLCRLETALSFSNGKS